MRYIIYFVVFCVFSLNLQAKQSSDSLTNNSAKPLIISIKPSVSITNLHAWRGLTSGTAPCVEPIVTFAYKNLSLDAWASYAFDNSYKEIDFILTYKYNFFSVTVADYYCPQHKPKVKFNNFYKGETDHLFEAKTSITVSKKIPVKLMAAVIFAGNDWQTTNTEIEQLYSTYFELSYPFALAKTPMQIEVGMTPTKGMYAKGTKVFNYGLTVFKKIKITKQFNLNTKYKLIYNLEKNLLHFSVALIL